MLILPSLLSSFLLSVESIKALSFEASVWSVRFWPVFSLRALLSPPVLSTELKPLALLSLLDSLVVVVVVLVVVVVVVLIAGVC